MIAFCTMEIKLNSVGPSLVAYKVNLNLNDSTISYSWNYFDV